MLTLVIAATRYSILWLCGADDEHPPSPLSVVTFFYLKLISIATQCSMSHESPISLILYFYFLLNFLSSRKKTENEAAEKFKL